MYQVSEQADSRRSRRLGAAHPTTVRSCGSRWIDRARRNSLNHAMIDDLVGILTAAATDDTLRAISIEGAGGDFCTGADWVATNDSGQRPRTGDLVRRIPHTAHRVIELVTTIHLPVVVRGAGVGGGPGLQSSRWPPTSPSPTPRPVLGAVPGPRFHARTRGPPGCCPRLVGLARARANAAAGREGHRCRRRPTGG